MSKIAATPVAMRTFISTTSVDIFWLMNERVEVRVEAEQVAEIF